jgi:hypothetical protein
MKTSILDIFKWGLFIVCVFCLCFVVIAKTIELAKQSEVTRIELEKIRDEIARLKGEKTKADIERVKQAQQMNTIQCLDMFYTMPELDNKNILDELNREYSGRLKLYFKIAEEQKEMEAK